VFLQPALPRRVDVPSGSIAATVVDFLIGLGANEREHLCWPKIEEFFIAERVTRIFSIAGEALFRDPEADPIKTTPGLPPLFGVADHQISTIARWKFEPIRRIASRAKGAHPSRLGFSVV